MLRRAKILEFNGIQTNVFTMTTEQQNRASDAAIKLVRESYIALGLDPDMAISHAVLDETEPLLSKHYYRNMTKTMTSTDERKDIVQSDSGLKKLRDAPGISSSSSRGAIVESVALEAMKKEVTPVRTAGGRGEGIYHHPSSSPFKPPPSSSSPRLQDNPGHAA